MSEPPNCPSNTFGRNCRSQCNCPDDTPCNQTTGACTNGCRENYWGQHCLLESRCTYNDAEAIQYRGNLSTTIDDKKCAPWKCYPAFLENKATRFVPGDEPSNHCRNPIYQEADQLRDTRPWCYYYQDESQTCKQTSTGHPTKPTKFGDCDLSACDCPDYWFGVNCRHQCNCYDRLEKCNGVTGACPGGCARGFQGHNCLTDLSLSRAAFTILESDRTSSSLAFNFRHDRLSRTCRYLDYNLKYRPQNNRFWTTLPNSHGRDQNPRFDLTNLEPNTSYEVRIELDCSLSNEAKLRYKSVQNEAELRTKCKVSETGPVITNVRRVQSPTSSTQALDVDWQELKMCGSSQTYYYVKYRRSGQAEWSSTNTMWETQTHLSGLQAFTKYQLKVVAMVGGREVEGPVYTTLKAKPDHIRELSARWHEQTNSAHVTWREPQHINDQSVTYNVYAVLLAIPGCARLPHGTGAPPPTTDIHGTETWLHGLKPNRRYDLEVEAVNSVGSGPRAQEQNFIVPAASPLTVPVVSADRVFPDKTQVRVSVSAYPCQHKNGNDRVSDSYQYQLLNEQGRVLKEAYFKIPYNSGNVTVEDLSPYSNYSFRYRYVNEVGPSPYSQLVNFTTKEDHQNGTELHTVRKNASAITVGWESPVKPRGIISRYLIRINSADGYRDKKCPASQREMTFTGLTAGKEYTFEMKIRTGAGWGVLGPIHKETPKEGLPSPPRSLSRVGKTSRSLILEWEQPSLPNGKIIDYMVRCQVNESLSGGSRNDEEEAVVTANTTVNVTTLHPATRYKCFVAASTSAGYGETVNQLFWTKPEQPSFNPDWIIGQQPSLTTDSSVTINIQPPDDAMKAVTSLRVAVEMKASERNKRSIQPNKSLEFHAAEKRGLPYYIAAELPASFRGLFVVGDNRTYGNYFNAALVTGRTYLIHLGLVSAADGEEAARYVSVGAAVTVLLPTPAAATNTGIIVAAVLFILILVPLLVVLVLLWRRYKQRTKLSKTDDVNSMSTLAPKHLNGMIATSTPRTAVRRPVGMVMEDTEDEDSMAVSVDEQLYANLPVPSKNSIAVTDLLEYVKRCKDNDNHLFIEEFKKFPADFIRPHDAAKATGNSSRNRFKNIVAYDHSRVRLEVRRDLDDVHSDYINASYIEGYQDPREYIAAQGPLPQTVADFWAMVWQEKTRQIVMLTNLVELGRTKCEQYWPHRTDVYREISVETTDAIAYRDMTIRTFQLTKGEDRRSVRQYHFTAWPDHGAPQFASSMLNFLRRTREDEKRNRGPIVVHCSAGVGRSGTFIALDVLTRMAEREQRVDVQSQVMNMRQARPKMVQTVEQYVFLHEALLEFTLVGVTTIASCDLVNTYNQLIVTNSCQKSQLQRQFDLVSSFDRTPEPGRSRAALATENLHKNRNIDIIPDDGQRPILMTPVKGRTNYINAVFVDNYDVRDAFIVTQHPLPHTQVDFWRLVWDVKSASIVMLNQFDNKAEDCPVYMPSSGTVAHGPFIVKFISQDRSVEAYTETTLKISFHPNLEESEASVPWRTVKHFLVNQWPRSEPVPSLPSTLIHLVDGVISWQRKSANKAIVVHCSDGADRSGLFCACYTALDKNQVEQELDVFQIVRQVRAHRHHLLHRYEQYQYIFRVVIDFIQNFGIYHNFK